MLSEVEVFVQSVWRSVANNLNDISKDNPGVVIDVLWRWQTDDSDKISVISVNLCPIKKA